MTQRFISRDNPALKTVQDTRTGLMWTRDACLPDFPMSWAESLEYIEGLNKRQEGGFNDWRLPNRRELFSLIDTAASNPAVAPGNPFLRIWSGWYWSSTTFAALPEYAWRVQFSGGRMFYGKKTEDSFLWPVRGISPVLHATGQQQCHNTHGHPVPCEGSGQDGSLRTGLRWDTRRFSAEGAGVSDTVSGLLWSRCADLTGGATTYAEALRAVTRFAQETGRNWRLPTIDELELLTDCSRAYPALTSGHPFDAVRPAYWSCTSSGYEKGWQYCLYMEKGAVGVGHAAAPEFHVWPVCSLP
jgi:hypothetical protein